MSIPDIITENKRIILLDGVCNLCSGFMQFVYKHDNKMIFKFAWLQEKICKDILDWLSLPSDSFETIILIEENKPYFKSTAFLKIVRHIRFPWPLLLAGYIVPRFIRDWVYDHVAQRRYKWFGKKDQCLVPTGDVLNRFL